MNKLGSVDLTQDDFQAPIPEVLLEELNVLGRELRDSRGATKRDLRREIKNLLPEGFLQKATFNCNYETAMTMYYQRKNHRLREWNARHEGSLCHWVLMLPYMAELMGLTDE